MGDNNGPQTRVILIRHGQTAWNKQEVFRGRADIPLDEVGLRQAEAVAEALAAEQITRVMTSPLSRAVKTAEALAASRQIVPVVMPAFIDMDFGEWEGQQHAVVREQFPELYAAWRDRPQEVQFPGGEDLEAVRLRAGAALDELVEQYPGETMAIVSHRVVNKLIICHILGLDNSHFWQIKQDTACLNRFRAIGGGYVLDCLNDTCHMRRLGFAVGDF